MKPDSIPRTGRLVAIDYGTVRIGVAITDLGQSIASPLEVYHRRNERLDADWFAKLVQREQVAGFIVGLPVHTSGAESRMSREAIAFGEWLHQLTGIPVTWFDERFTSSMAEEVFLEVKRTKAQRIKLRDKLAAQLLLRNYLESDRDNPPSITGIDES